jgi:effector-binding domain-containing protein
MPDEPIAVKIVESMPLAAVRRQVTADNLAQEVVKAPIWSLVESRGLKSLGETVLIYYDRDDEMLRFQPGGVAVDMGIALSEPFEGDRALQCVWTPAGRVAWIRHHGHYELLPAIHGDIRAWCASEGHRIAGINWEHFGVWNEEPERLITDVYYLLRDTE